MRYDLRVLWVEDTPTFYNETKEILEMVADDNGISLKFDYIENAKDFFKRIQKELQGFKLYDIFFVDYSLSDGILGSSLIKKLRDEKVDSDILFYSSENEEVIREKVKADLGAFEGVYIANKTNFEEKSNYLINKNARKLTKLSNIRGFLMDQTSENDYTIKSYILRNFQKLPPSQQKEIEKLILESIKGKVQLFNNKAEQAINNLETKGITNINQTMNMMDELLPLKLKYQVFSNMVKFLGETAFEEITVQQYVDEIISARNKLAHKKLDICKAQKYIKYYDNINHFENRQCPKDCKDHLNDNKYSLEQWNTIRKNAQRFGKSIDAIQSSLDENKHH